MKGIFAFLLIISAPILGALPLIFRRISGEKFKTWNKKKKIMSVVSLIIGISLYISFFVSFSISEKINQITYSEYPIQYLTINKVYFDNNDGCFLNDENVFVKTSNTKNNIVIVEKRNYEVQWLWKIPNSSYYYHVYLSEENYKKIQNTE